MHRPRRKIWTPKVAIRIRNFLNLIIDTHPAGFNVLCGLCVFPTDDEIHELYNTYGGADTGIRIQGGDGVNTIQKTVERWESEDKDKEAFFSNGGTEYLYKVMTEYKRDYHKSYCLLRDMSNLGLPGALTQEKLCNRYGSDIKTLKKEKLRILEEIAMAIVYYPDKIAILDPTIE